jgi:hypothetical protein
MKTHEASRANEAFVPPLLSDSENEVIRLLQLKQTVLYHQSTPNASENDVTSLVPLKRRVPVGPHCWTGRRSFNHCLQPIKKVIVLTLREQDQLVHQRLPGLLRFQAGQADSGRLGIDAYLHGDKATQRLCGGHVAECGPTVPWKCLISLTLRIISLTGLGNRAFMVTA